MPMQPPMRFASDARGAGELVFPEDDSEDMKGDHLPSVRFVMPSATSNLGGDGSTSMAYPGDETQYPQAPLDMSEVDVDVGVQPLSARQSKMHRSMSARITPQQKPRVESAVVEKYEVFEGDSMMRPRGGAGANDYSAFSTRAHRTRVYRSWCSRVTYALLLLNMLIWVPLWLKLLTIRRQETNTGETISIYNSSIIIELNVSTFDDPEGTACGQCDEADDGEFGVTYPVTAIVKNFHDYEEISSASYISLIASYDFENWFTVNQPGMLTGIPPKDSTIEVCRADPLPLDDDALLDDDPTDDEDDEPKGSLVTSTFTKKETTTVNYNADQSAYEDDDITIYSSIEYYTETTKTTVSPTTVAHKATDAPTPLDFDDMEVSRCCLDKPGFIYLVACASPYEYLAESDFYTKVNMPPFDEQCIGIGSRCGVACNVEADVPVPDSCDQSGQIPIKELVKKKVYRELDLDDDIADDDRRRLQGTNRRHFDKGFQLGSSRSKLYQMAFVFFVTLMAVGTWISFMSGTGSIQEPLKPSMSEVEAYMATEELGHNKKKPLCLVAFSISASEARMMVLRNMCGKLMSWIHQRKFTLAMRKPDMPSVLDTDPASQSNNAKSMREIRANTIRDHVEFIDLLADEGHRIGAYALWDAFVDVVHECDLRFVENMANKMTSMEASDDRLQGQRKDDIYVLDDELREMIRSKPDEMRITQEQIDRLELAYAVYDLLTTLGHHSFWRPDGSVNVVGFRELASEPGAVAVLRTWAENFKEEKKKSGNPFAPNVAPTSDPGIDRDTWNGWWELYDELGRSQWVKRFDCTKFRRVRVHYDRGQNGDNHCRDLMMCYAARANPEDLKIQLAPTVMRRGIDNGVFVRLKEATSSDDEVSELFNKHGMKPLSRAMARRCHARVVSKLRRKDGWHVKVKECTPDMLTALPPNFLVNSGRVGNDSLDADFEAGRTLLGDVTHDRVRDYEHQGEEAIIPLKLVMPLRESRGKSGGMNHCMEILNFYLRHYSSTMQVMKMNREFSKLNVLGETKTTDFDAETPPRLDIPENDVNNDVKACLLFAIFDCRHMATQGFWDVVIPYFYKYEHLNNPWSRELAIDRPVAFVQLPQSFTSLTIDDDIFDMRNEYLFRLANNIRSGVGAITSCGTNAVWNYDIRFQADPLLHRFNEDTMIEDTASSHDVIQEGRKGVYHFERLVLGARKGTNDYLAAVFRWSRGAVQLFWTTFWFPRSRMLWPWVMLLVHVVPIVTVTVYLQWAKLDRCHQTSLTQRMGWMPCRSGAFLGLVADPVFVIYFVVMCTIIFSSFSYHRIGAFTVMFENVTYFFSSVSAFYWTSLPVYICVAKRGVPAVFDTQLLTLGALWLQLHSALVIQSIKGWSPKENGSAPSDQSLLRSQQMYIVTAPLHFLAIVFGMKDGFDICFRKKDASRWSSFDSIMAMSCVKLWVIVLFGTLCISIIWGVVNGVLYDDGTEERGVRALGVFFCIALLFIVWTPVRAMFFYDSVVKSKRTKSSRMDRLTAAVFGKKQPIRPDYVYLLLWVFLIIYAFRGSQLAESEGVLNGRSRCSIDGDKGGCDPADLYKFTRVGNEGLVQ